MAKELWQWAPSHWTDERRRLYMLHLRRHTFNELGNWIGPYNAGLAMAEIIRDWDERDSKQMMKAQGIPSIGEVEALQLLHSKNSA